MIDHSETPASDDLLGVSKPYTGEVGFPVLSEKEGLELRKKFGKSIRFGAGLVLVVLFLARGAGRVMIARIVDAIWTVCFVIVSVCVVV